MKREIHGKLAHLRDTYMKAQDLVKFTADLFIKERKSCKYYVEPEKAPVFADSRCSNNGNEFSICCLVLCPLRKEESCTK